MADSTQPDQEDAIESAHPNANVPKEPETEKGRQVREQYLAYARASLGNKSLSYLQLYQRYAGTLPSIQQEAKALDRSVAIAALKAGSPPRQVMQLVAQGPFTQCQTQNLSPEEKQAALPQLLQYAQATVEAAQRQRFVEYANAVTGKSWNYPDLYREHIGSDLAAIQLDQKVTAAALQAGESADAVVTMLQQSPYARFQQDVKQVKTGTIERYARGTVAQVQEIQALRPLHREQTQQKRSKGIEQ